MYENTERAAALLAEQERAVMELKLSASGLPAELHDMVKQAIKPGWSIADLDTAIGNAKAAWAKLEEKRTVNGINPQISGMTTSLDRITDAAQALIEGRRPKVGAPLTGLRELYMQLSGDYELNGRFYSDRVQLANVNSSTMANIVADILNKRVVNEFQTYPQWWGGIVRQEDFTTLQTVSWITLGGIGELPTVAEGAGYTELTWDDNAETASWVKKGGYLGITMEAIDRDDVGRLRAAPRALAQSAYMTLGKAVSGIFTGTSGTGPLLADGGRLFNATAVSTTGGHANLLTSALSPSAWSAVKLAMRKQTELNSGERLGGLVVPKYMLVPPDLEQTGLQVLASEGVPFTADNTVNVEAQGNTHDDRLAAARRRLVVVDFWTDTNNWAAVADPQLYPTIGIGYRYGREPEIFSVASDTSGLMFTNDTMPIKVRFFFAVGPQDYRGLFKCNVS